MASISTAAPQFLVSKLSDALTFYEERLGFERDFVYADFSIRRPSPASCGSTSCTSSATTRFSHRWRCSLQVSRRALPPSRAVKCRARSPTAAIHSSAGSDRPKAAWDRGCWFRRARTLPGTLNGRIATSAHNLAHAHRSDVSSRSVHSKGYGRNRLGARLIRCRLLTSA